MPAPTASSSSALLGKRLLCDCQRAQFHGQVLIEMCAAIEQELEQSRRGDDHAEDEDEEDAEDQLPVATLVEFADETRRGRLWRPAVLGAQVPTFPAFAPWAPLIAKIRALPARCFWELFAGTAGPVEGI